MSVTFLMRLQPVLEHLFRAVTSIDPNQVFEETSTAHREPEAVEVFEEEEDGPREKIAEIEDEKTLEIENVETTAARHFVMWTEVEIEIPDGIPGTIFEVGEPHHHKVEAVPRVMVIVIIEMARRI